MSHLNTYLNTIKKQSQLLSNDDIENIIIKHGKSKKQSTYKNSTIKLLAASLLIFLAIGSALFINTETEPYSINNYALNENRYVEFINTIYENPDSYSDTHVMFSNNSHIPIHLTAQVELPIEKLLKMGFKVTETEVVYETNVTGKGHLSFQLKSDNTSVYVSDNMAYGIKEYDFYPLYLSDLDGKQGVKFRFNKEPEDKFNTYEDRINSLIPIVVNVPNSTRQKIFWFLSTEKLLDILDEKNNYNASLNKALQKENLNSIKVYPNPTKGSISIQTEYKKGDIKIELLDVNGSLIRVLQNKSQIVSPSPKYNYSLYGINKGIYLIAISIDGEYKGFKKIILTQ